MQSKQQPTTAQLRDDIDAGRTGSKVAGSDPVAAPLGTDDEAAGNTASSERVEMARRAEQRIGEAAKRGATTHSSARKADDQAQSQRGSSAPFAKEDHMNNELVRRTKEREQTDTARTESDY